MNKHRGEVEYKVGDRELILRPTNEAMQEIQDKLDIGLLRLALIFNNLDGRIEQAARIIYEGAKASGSLQDGEDIDAVRDMMHEVGLASALGAASVLLARGLDPGGEKKKEQAVPRLATG